MLRAITNDPAMRERSVVKLSVTPSTKYFCSGSPPRLAKGKTTMDQRGGPAFSWGAKAGPKVDTNSKLDAAVGRQAASVALDHAGLHLNGATNRIYDASELNEDAIAGGV